MKTNRVSLNIIMFLLKLADLDKAENGSRGRRGRRSNQSTEIVTTIIICKKFLELYFTYCTLHTCSKSRLGLPPKASE